MYSIQEMIEKTQIQRKAIEQTMDANKCFHPEDANIFSGQKRSVERELRESLNRLSLSQLLEFLIKSGTQGIAGAAYLVPDKVSQTLYHAAKRYDIVPLISQVITGWQGAAIDVNIAVDESYKPKYFGGGGSLPEETVKTVQATITPISFGINAKITKDLLEDQQYGLIEWHMQKAAQRMADFASDMALTVLLAAPDGDGDLNTETPGEAMMTDYNILDSVTQNAYDGFISNTLVIHPSAWSYTVGCGSKQITPTIAGDVLLPVNPIANPGAPALGYDMKWHMLDTLFVASTVLTTAGDPMYTIVFDRNNAMLTGRKRWLQIDNYSDPIRDLAGAVISARQDSVTLYKDAICLSTATS